MKKVIVPFKDGEMMFRRRYEKEDIEVTISHAEVMLSEAAMANRIMLEMSRAPYNADGEDSAGRQKGRRMHVEEIVATAFDLAAEFMKQARERKLMEKMPSMAEQEEMLKNAEDKN